jgi:4-hydroxy-tetrahydrodipicolinate synthase
MVRAVLSGKTARAEQLKNALDPLFKVVTVNTIESYEGFEVPCKFRNPVPIKAIMKGLGLPSGACRSPLGKMTPKGVEVVRNAIKEVYSKDREVLRPIEDFYRINVEERLSNDRHWK